MLYDYSGYPQNMEYFQRQGYAPYTQHNHQTDDSSDVLDELGDIASEVSQKVYRKIRRGYEYLQQHPMLCEAAYFTAVFSMKLGLYMLLIKGAENGYEGSL